MEKLIKMPSANFSPARTEDRPSANDARIRNDLRRRCYHFSIQTLKFCEHISTNRVYPCLIEQLVRSSSALGSHVLEARMEEDIAMSRDHYQKAADAAREVRYWLCLVRDTFDVEKPRANSLLEEALAIGDMLAKQLVNE